MKKNILALAVAGLIAGGAHAADDKSDLLKVYGKANVSFTNVDKDGSDDAWKLNSNASRIGVKGSMKLNDSGLKAFYKFEYETFIDDGEKNDDQTFSQRNIIVGLKGGFGQVWGGKHDTPTKLAQKKVDLFNDLDGDIKKVLKGENRVSNIINYTTPKMGDVTLSIATVLSEDAGDSLSESYSMLAKYDTKDVYVAFAFDENVSGRDTKRLVGQFNMGKFQLGTMWQNSQDSAGGIIDEDSLHISGKLKIANGYALKAQWTSTDDDNTGYEADMISLGFDKKLGKKTKLFSYYTMKEINNSDEDVLGFGMEHKF